MGEHSNWSPSASPTLDARDWVGRAPTTSDRSAQLQAALDAARDSGPGARLELPPWEILVSAPVVIDSFVELVGAAGASRIKVGSGSNCGALKSARYGAGGAGGGTERIAISAVDFDGNFAGNPGVTEPVVALDGIRPIVDLVHVKNGYINLSSIMSRAGSAGGSKAEDGVFSRITLFDSQARNLDITGPHDTQLGTILARTNSGVNVRCDCLAAIFSHTHAYGNAEYPFEMLKGHTDNCIAEGGVKAQMIILSDSQRHKNLWAFSAGGADGKVGVKFGDATHTANNTLLENARIDNCTNGSFDFTNTNGAGSRITGWVTGESGTAIVGTPSSSVSLDLTLGGTIALGTSPEIASVASAAELAATLSRFHGQRDVAIKVSGVAEIKKIKARAAQQKLTLIFTSTAKVIDGENLKLNGNFEATADDVLQLVCDGTNWYETGRSAN